MYSNSNSERTSHKFEVPARSLLGSQKKEPPVLSPTTRMDAEKTMHDDAKELRAADFFRLAKGGKPLGFLNPWIYKNAAAFNDVTHGVNDEGSKTRYMMEAKMCCVAHEDVLTYLQVQTIAFDGFMAQLPAATHSSIQLGRTMGKPSSCAHDNFAERGTTLQAMRWVV